MEEISRKQSVTLGMGNGLTVRLSNLPLKFGDLNGGSMGSSILIERIPQSVTHYIPNLRTYEAKSLTDLVWSLLVLELEGSNVPTGTITELEKQTKDLISAINEALYSIGDMKYALNEADVVEVAYTYVVVAEMHVKNFAKSEGWVLTADEMYDSVYMLLLGLSPIVHEWYQLSKEELEESIKPLRGIVSRLYAPTGSEDALIPLSLNVRVETGTVEVVTKERAVELICATAMTLSATSEDLKASEGIQRVANFFGIDTDDIVVELSKNEEELKYGYPYKYAYRPKV